MPVVSSASVGLVSAPPPLCSGSDQSSQVKSSQVKSGDMKEIPVPALPVISLLISVVMSSLAGSCPHHCKCLWRASKITLDCAGGLHTALPSLMTTDTQVLNMTHTTITSLESRVFLSRNLSNLQRLHITESPLTQIHSQVRPPFSLDCLRSNSDVAGLHWASQPGGAGPECQQTL